MASIETPTVHPRASHRGRARWIGAAAMACGLILVAAACDVPAKPAAGLFDSWKGNDADGAHAFATNTAVDEIFAKTYRAKSGWFFSNCEGAAGSTYCTWINNVETTLILRVSNQAGVVSSAAFTPIESGVIGRFFHAWRDGNHTEAAKYGTATAVTQLYSATYSAAKHWVPDSCSGAAGSIYCTFRDDSGGTIRLHLDDVGTHKVVSVAHHGS